VVLCPRPRWGSLQRSPDPIVVFNGLPLTGWKRGEGKGKENGRKGGKEGMMEERGKGIEGKD